MVGTQNDNNQPSSSSTDLAFQGLSDPIIVTAERLAPGHGHDLGRHRREADFLPLESLSFAPSLQGLDVLASHDPMAPAFANGLADTSATIQPPWLIAAEPLH